MRLLRISLESPSVMCEIQNQTNHITMLLISSFTSIYWVKLDYRKVKFLAIDFTGGVIFQPYFIYDPSNIIPKANVYVVC
jgi:hypothetical protein